MVVSFTADLIPGPAPLGLARTALLLSFQPPLHRAPAATGRATRRRGWAQGLLQQLHQPPLGCHPVSPLRAVLTGGDHHGTRDQARRKPLQGSRFKCWRQRWRAEQIEHQLNPRISGVDVLAARARRARKPPAQLGHWNHHRRAHPQVGAGALRSHGSHRQGFASLRPQPLAGLSSTATGDCKQTAMPVSFCDIGHCQRAQASAFSPQSPAHVCFGPGSLFGPGFEPGWGKPASQAQSAAHPGQWWSGVPEPGRRHAQHLQRLPVCAAQPGPTR